MKVLVLVLSGAVLLGCSREGDPIPAYRAAGTEPFWGLSIDDEGMRFTTPEHPEGRLFPPTAPVVDGNSLRWSVVSGTASIDARIQPGQCSDMMSDKLWTHNAVVQIDQTNYRGCAEIPFEPSLAHDAIGEWIIVFHRMPGISAMGYDEAIQWHGRTVQLGVDAAVSTDDVCDDPDYRYQTTSADDYLATGFRITPADLGLDQVNDFGVTEVFCGDERWDAPGALLIWFDHLTPYTVWDGVFFELRRLP